MLRGPSSSIVFGVAALEVLAERNAESLLTTRLSIPRRKAVRRSVEAALKAYEELASGDIARLLERFMDTQVEGASRVGRRR
jgi:hypothetical protein